MRIIFDLNALRAEYKSLTESTALASLLSDLRSVFKLNIHYLEYRTWLKVWDEAAAFEDAPESPPPNPPYGLKPPPWLNVWDEAPALAAVEKWYFISYFSDFKKKPSDL